jgi:hypothetical protein
MALTLRSTPTPITQSTSATSFVATCPTGTVAGDVIYLAVSSAGAQGSTPAGFTQLFQLAGTSCTLTLYARTATGADVAGTTTYTVNISLSKYGALIWSEGGALFALDSVCGTPGNVGTASTAVQYPATTVVASNATVFGLGALRNAAVNLTNNDTTPPAGFTELAEVWSTQSSGGAVGNSGLQLISFTPGAAGTVTPAATTTVDSSVQVLYTFSVAPAPVVTGVFTGTTVAYELNRLAGTLGPNGQVRCDAAKAANIWAGTSGLDLDGALAVKSGSSGSKAKGSANLLAGTSNADLAVALSLIAS